LGRFTGDGPSAVEIERCVAFFKEIAPYAQAKNVTLAGEAINRFETFFVNTIAQGINIVDAAGCANFGLHVDTYHGNFEELDICASWRNAGERIRHVHISENTRGVPGTGCAVRPEVFQVLKEIGYTGWLTIEAFSRAVPALSARLHIWREMATPEAIAVQGLQYIDQMLKRFDIPRG
jgi:D-psicose/D-tagatose/L-ribulose 3-epimerase